MSIGEIISIYKEGELDIHPEFQRFFRWNESQKSKLIESILLGIPIPSIFVSQRENGVWDVIDGLQRLSTIFEFAGILKDRNGELKDASTLRSTKYLPSLEGKKWDSEEENSLTADQRLYIKRSRLNLQIVQKESDDDTKYELFQRLNTGGTPLSNQELRNCLLLMIDNDFFEWLSDLVKDENFQNTISLSDKNLEERYDVELALRFFINKNSTEEELTNFRDIGEFITDQMITFTKPEMFDRDIESELFKDTFSLLYSALEDNAFKKYNFDKNKFEGGFSISAFEAVSTGISFNEQIYDKTDENDKNILVEKVKNLWSEDWFKSHSGAGVQAYRRLRKFVPNSKEYFSK
jgi:uncharacterized protein with ParB-like and HNH nuclease domain